jgi:hypothetical protein
MVARGSGELAVAEHAASQQTPSRNSNLASMRAPC